MQQYGQKLFKYTNIFIQNSSQIKKMHINFFEFIQRNKNNIIL